MDLPTLLAGLVVAATLAVVIVTYLRRSSRNPAMIVRYADDLRLFPNAARKLGAVAVVLLWLLVPMSLTDYQLNILSYAGIAAVGALGLNLLVGYTGQVSLGHGFFVAVGSYTVAYLGAAQGWPLVLWLPAAALIGALVGASIGPFALRLRGNYLVIVTLGLLFVGEYVFDNWESVTGGSTGVATTGAIPKLSTAEFELAGLTYSDDQGYFWLIWFVVGIAVLVAKNIVRTRAGRAMQAIRDRDLAAEVIGVSLARYKVGAFAWSSAFAAVAGALYGALQGFVNWVDPPTAMLLLSIQYIAIVIIGGVGTIYGPVLGALLVGSLPQIIQSLSLNTNLPFVSGDAGGQTGFVEVASLNNVVYGLVIILFLVFEPYGIAGIWRRVRTWFLSWPFSYS
jgi:branched-chain amino acid transport system permease protein